MAAHEEAAGPDVTIPPMVSQAAQVPAPSPDRCQMALSSPRTKTSMRPVPAATRLGFDEARPPTLSQMPHAVPFHEIVPVA